MGLPIFFTSRVSGLDCMRVFGAVFVLNIKMGLVFQAQGASLGGFLLTLAAQDLIISGLWGVKVFILRVLGS